MSILFGVNFLLPPEEVCSGSFPASNTRIYLNYLSITLFLSKHSLVSKPQKGVPPPVWYIENDSCNNLEYAHENSDIFTMDSTIWASHRDNAIPYWAFRKIVVFHQRFLFPRKPRLKSTDAPMTLLLSHYCNVFIIISKHYHQYPFQTAHVSREDWGNCPQDTLHGLTFIFTFLVVEHTRIHVKLTIILFDVSKS